MHVLCMAYWKSHCLSNYCTPWPLCSSLWIRCRLFYSLLRAAIMCVRGGRSTIGRALKELEVPIGLVSSEGHVPWLEWTRPSCSIFCFLFCFVVLVYIFIKFLTFTLVHCSAFFCIVCIFKVSCMEKEFAHSNVDCYSILLNMEDQKDVHEETDLGGVLRDFSSSRCTMVTALRSVNLTTINSYVRCPRHGSLHR